jgi:hypothetical protein
MKNSIDSKPVSDSFRANFSTPTNANSNRNFMRQTFLRCIFLYGALAIANANATSYATINTSGFSFTFRDLSSDVSNPAEFNVGNPVYQGAAEAYGFDSRRFRTSAEQTNQNLNALIVSAGIPFGQNVAAQTMFAGGAQGARSVTAYADVLDSGAIVSDQMSFNFALPSFTEVVLYGGFTGLAESGGGLPVGSNGYFASAQASVCISADAYIFNSSNCASPGALAQPMPESFAKMSDAFASNYSLSIANTLPFEIPVLVYSTLQVNVQNPALSGPVSPIPEPDQYVMLIAGLVTSILMARRRAGYRIAQSS